MTVILNPLFYINGKPHIGHHYTIALSSSLGILRLLQGDSPLIVSGTDENGEKVYREYLEYCKNNTEVDLNEYKTKYRELFHKELFSKHPAIVQYSTSALYHYRLVNSNMRKLFRDQHIYPGVYSSDYDLRYEHYVDEQYVRSLDEKTRQKYIINTKENGFFYRISEKNRSFLINSLSTIVPSANYHPLITKYLTETSDIFITRKKTDNCLLLQFDDAKYGLYVWFEAIQYYLYYFRNFPAVEPYIVIGKDISMFHTILLGSLCLDTIGYIPYKLIIHPMIINNERKLGKSEGNTGEYDMLISDENLRFTSSYLVTRSLNKDFAITIDNVNSHKMFIINNIGNLISRYFTLYQQHFFQLQIDDFYSMYSHEMIAYMYEVISKIDMNTNFLDVIIDLSNRANKFINDSTLWENTQNKAQAMFVAGEYVLKIMLLYLIIDPKSLEFVLQFYSSTNLSGALYMCNSLLCMNINEIKNLKLA